MPISVTTGSRRWGLASSTLCMRGSNKVIAAALFQNLYNCNTRLVVTSATKNISAASAIYQLAVVVNNYTQRAGLHCGHRAGGTALRRHCLGKPLIYIWCHAPYGNIYVTVSEKTDHLAAIQFVQYGSKALHRSRSRDFTISMPRCSTAS